MTDKNTLAETIESKESDLLNLLGDLVAAKTVTGDEAPAQEVIIDRLETMNLEPDVGEPSADNLADHEGYFETSSYEAYGYEGRPNVAARASKVAMVRPWRSAATST